MGVPPVDEDPGGHRRGVGADATQVLEGLARVGRRPRQGNLGQHQQGPRVIGSGPEIRLAPGQGLVEPARAGKLGHLFEIDARPESSQEHQGETGRQRDEGRRRQQRMAKPEPHPLARDTDNHVDINDSNDQEILSWLFRMA